MVDYAVILVSVYIEDVFGAGPAGYLYLFADGIAPVFQQPFQAFPRVRILLVGLDRGLNIPAYLFQSDDFRQPGFAGQ